MRYAGFISRFNKAKSLELKENRILMFSTSKGELGGNLLAIKNYIESNSLDYEIEVVTSLNRPDDNTLAKLMAQSRFILVDDYEPLVYTLKLRKGQHLVQVWHAMGAFKRFGYARESAEKNSLTHKNYTEAICSSPELVPLYAQSFGIDESKVKAVGVPRTDIFFDEKHISSVKERIYSQYPGLMGKKICLFAPTFRGENVNNAFYPKEYFDVEKLSVERGGEWAIIIKLHPFVKNRIQIPEGLKERVFDLSAEREINDILFITDVLVTDYSSVIFENAVIGNAAVLYVPDLEEYKGARGFYFEYENYACGEIVRDKNALSAAILAASAEDERMSEFKKRFVSLCDGNSSRRFTETILEEN